jgi:hypothetical protein
VAYFTGYLDFSAFAAGNIQFLTSAGLAQQMAGGFAGGLVAGNGDIKVAVQSALTAGAFNFAGANIKDAVGQIAAHAGIGCASAEASGGKCGAGALSAGVAKFATQRMDARELGVIGKGVAVSVIGGTASVIGGGKFENGAVTAAFGYLFNCLASQCNTSMYDRNDPATHFSAAQASPVACNISVEACFSVTADVMACNSGPGQPGCTPKGVDTEYALKSYVSLNKITQYRYSDSLLVNGTSPGHVFHDGYVVRWIEIDSLGDVRIWSAGYGTNYSRVHAWINENRGNALFRDIGVQNAAEVQRRLSTR